jgi:antitoxin (DNA-binding transcriptional repressor) of toxin-antitoxin stability system
MIVNMHQAKTQLSKLVKEASQGTEVVIAIDGQPMVKLTALKNQKRRPRKSKGWPVRVMAFTGIADVKPFEDFRDTAEPKDPVL